MPGEFVMGAWRGMFKWEALRDSAPTKFQTDLWSRYVGANVGVVLGSPIGALKLIAIDVDTTDADELRDVLGALPYSPMVKRGSKGETRFYAADVAIKSTPYDNEVLKAADKAAGVLGSKYRLVDLLTGFDTRQTVCPPSMHPDGMAYKWLEGPVHVSDLPEFTADDLAVLEETLESLGWLRKAARGVQREGRSSAPADADDFFSETKTAALADLSAWVHDLDLYDLRPARGGFEAVATWRPSSTGQPIAKRKRNLSIQANGVKDFGTNWTGSAIDLVMMAQGLDQAAATSWLRTRCGLDCELIVLEPRKATKSAQVEAFTPSAHVLGKAEHVKSTELPDHLTRVPGLVGMITDWISDSAMSPQRGLALGAALTLVGTAAGRKVAGPTRSGTHLYVLGIARTGAGKDHPLAAITTILEAADMSAHLGPGQFMSMSAMVNRLTRQPLTLSPIDEFGSFLARINGNRSSTHERAISGTMRSVWGRSFQTVPPMEWAGRSSEPIYSPAFSVYGVTTPEEFYSAVEGADVSNGFLNRILTISTTTVPNEVDPTANPFVVPLPVVEGMREIYNLGGPLLRSTMHAGRSDPPAIDVPWADGDAKCIYDKFRLRLKQREADAAFLARTAEMGVRLATIRAIGRNSVNPAITTADMRWGGDVALWSGERMIQDAADFISETPTQAETKNVLRAIKEAVRISHSDLLKKLQHRMKGREVNDMVQSLSDARQIKIEEIRPVAGGKPAKFYAAA